MNYIDTLSRSMGTVLWDTIIVMLCDLIAETVCGM